MKSDYFVVADAVHVFEEGKLVIVGTFDTIKMPKLPGTFRPFAVAGKILPDKSDYGKTQHLQLSMRHASARKPLFRAAIEISFSRRKGHPRGIPGSALLVSIVGPVRFPKTGTYHLAIREEGKRKPICQTSLYVQKAQATTRRS